MAFLYVGASMLLHQSILKHQIHIVLSWWPLTTSPSEIEANSYTDVTTKNMVKFIHRDIIARYGVLEAIITDNESNLNNKVVDELLNEFQICR